MEGTFRGPHPPGLRLVETLRWQPGPGFQRLDAHLARLAAGAATLGFRFDRAAVDRALAETGGTADLRVRLTLDAAGHAKTTAAPLGPARTPWTLTLAETPLHSGDPWLHLKTTHRPIHDAARARLPEGIDEALLLNARGELCEGPITNVFVARDGLLLTPPLACGLLPGVLRADLLARGEAREAILHPRDLAEAPVFVGNSLRGLIPARLA